MKIFSKENIKEIAEKQVDKIFEGEDLLDEEITIVKQGFRLGYTVALKDLLIDYRIN